MWQMTSRNGYATALGLLETTVSLDFVCGCTPGGLKLNVFNGTMPFVDVQCIPLVVIFL